MMSFNLKSLVAARPIGLDIGHSCVRMIQLAVSGDNISVAAADKVDLDLDCDGDELARRHLVVSAINQMRARGNFRGAAVVSCLPADKVKIASLRVSAAEVAQLEKTLRREAAGRFGLDPETDSMDYIPAGSVRHGDETKDELILFGAEDQAIREHIDMLEQAALRPVAIDTVPCALFRSFERLQRRQEDQQQSVVFVDVGDRLTTVVFGRGGEISFVKQIPIGGRKFTGQVAQKLDISLAEARRLREKMRLENNPAPLQPQVPGEPLDAGTRQVITDAIGSVAVELAREIALCLRYFTVTFRGKRVERAFLSGGEAHEDILLNVLRRQLAVEIGVAHPLRGFDVSGSKGTVNLGNDRRGPLCEWAVAVGLALKGVQTCADSRTAEVRT